MFDADDWLSAVGALIRSRFGLEFSDIGGEESAVMSIHEDIPPEGYVEWIGAKYGLVDVRSSHRSY